MLTMEEAASELGVSVRTIENWIRLKGLPFHVWGRGAKFVSRRIAAADLAEFVFNGPMPRFHESGCEHSACAAWRWRRDNARKANAAMRRKQREAKGYHKNSTDDPDATTDAQSSSPTDPDPSSK